MADKPRILQDGKDLIWSLIALGVIILVVAGVAGSCSWGFGSDATEQNVPHFDVSEGLRADANTMGFPIRDPKVPNDWQANSGSTQEIAETISSNVGWITDGGAYVQLTQTDATEESLMRKLLGDDTSGNGTRDIGGQMWVTYENLEHQKAWIVDLGNVRIGVKSRGKDDSMQTLAEAVLAAKPLAADRPMPTG
ncbi:DUF4245 domain-containing protein [Gordonia sp. HY285]|uniref:DUF4245 domain-containing protein n=1 Tax=Gordonia liuliyuniae TaxID=2911517 RepID=UPI001F28D588|nr:DUF4245 domain-containing protein [Gordonia liuliyuniae]MCF8611636.1 DUF4245 domain-containing protein [Gordonia liuliyuniae]